MAAAASKKPSPLKVPHQRKRQRKDPSSKTSRDHLPPEQVNSTNQRITDSSERRLYKMFETLIARIQVLEDHDLAHAQPGRQHYSSQCEITHVLGENTNRSLYKVFEATLARVAVLESRRDICYRNAFKAADRGKTAGGEECHVRGCPTISSEPKNAYRHLKNTATPEHEVAAAILQQTECLQCDKHWERPSGLAHHESTVHQETYASRMDSLKSFIEQPFNSITESKSATLSPSGSDVLQSQAYSVVQPSWSSINNLQLSANPASVDAPPQPWQPEPDSSQNMVQTSWSSSNDLQSLADPHVFYGSTQMINRSRQDTLSEIFTYLQETLEKYQGSERICPQGVRCDGMLLGSLTRGLKAINVLPTVNPPYDGFSVKGLFERLKAMELPQCCSSNDLKSMDYYSRATAINCSGILKAKIKQKIKGLELTGGISSS